MRLRLLLRPQIHALNRFYLRGGSLLDTKPVPGILLPFSCKTQLSCTQNGRTKQRFTGMQSLKDDGIFTSGDEDLKEGLGDALFDPSLPIEGEGEEEAPVIADEEETPEEF